VYSAAKAGLDALADSLRSEATGTGVHIAVVVPGVVNTGFFEKRGRPYDRARPKPVPPEAVADAVLEAVCGRPEVWVPRWLRVAPTVRAIAPVTFRRLATRFGEPVRLDRP
jgi:short-subunit dehydrogenase